MSTYEGDFNRLKKTFVEFLHNLPFYGLAIVCVDDPVVWEILPQVSRPLMTYGFDDNADIKAVKNNYQSFNLADHIEKKNYLFSLPMPGKHNLYNAAAAIAASIEEGIPIKSIQQGLKNFKGVSRRFEKHEIKINKKKIILIDDYGHHPEEIRSTINAIHQAFPKKKICMICSPYSFRRSWFS